MYHSGKKMLSDWG